MKKKRIKKNDKHTMSRGCSVGRACIYVNRRVRAIKNDMHLWEYWGVRRWARLALSSLSPSWSYTACKGFYKMYFIIFTVYKSNASPKIASGKKRKKEKWSE